MSALLDQFVQEAGELIESAAKALLTLERNPTDAAAVNDLFRSVHTLKGTSALFDFPALTKVVHAGEDVLDGVREGTIAVSAPLVDVQLEVLDLLREWIDAVRRAGGLPDDAAAASRDLLARLAQLKSSPAAALAVVPASLGPARALGRCDWIVQLSEADRIAAFRSALTDRVALVAVAYAPDTDCYFRGEDPLLTCRGIPDLLGLSIDLVGPAPAPGEFDPYQCGLRLYAVSSAPRSELDHLFRYVSELVDIVEVTPEQLAQPVGSSDVSTDCAAFARELVRPWSSVDDAALRDRVATLLPSVDPRARSASALRWLLAMLEAGNTPPDWLARMLAAVGGADVDWSAPIGGPAAVPMNDAIASGFVVEATVPAVAPAARPNVGREPAKVDTDAHHIRMLKVDQAKVDRLMALIGELVVAKNALPFLARRAHNVHGSRELSREIGQRYSVIDRLAQEMQEAIMEVRLLPVSEVFARFPRLIRDVSRKLDKQIELVLEGEETQADKNIIELLGDPLIHIVRNAADHGIESPASRIAAGKPAQGTIRLRAMQEGDRVVIEVSDDGRGVDTARVVAKALERGIIDPGEAERMTPAEAANLIFHPGLSTAEQISDLSGRGVGMDVVQTAIRDAGGSVNVASRPGLGTTVRLALPLSMAVMRVMTIETAGALYGVPIDLIAETVRIEALAIREIKQSEAFLLRDTIVPLVRLRRVLRLPSRGDEREAVLVLRTPGGLVGIIVDRFDEHMDIILKPLEGILAGLRGFAGTALLGDGRVLMVLDVKELLECH
jgi:two-component system chemotaxis sensor kinase CheA